MSSHATATHALHNLQTSGQTSAVGHHRGYSQPSVTVATNSAGDPWFLQSTGHQMPPTAPLRHNKRPAPQPSGISGIAGGSANVAAAITDGLLHQQQLSQSQPHIVPPNIPPHQNNNPHTSAIHLSSHALSSHNSIASNLSPKSPSQQQQSTTLSSATIVAQSQQQHQHPHVHLHGVLNNHVHAGASVTSSAVVAAVNHQQQQHLHLLTSCGGSNSGSSNNNSLMSSSLNAAQLQGHMSVPGTGSVCGTSVVPITLGLDRGLSSKCGLGGLHGSNVLLHTTVQPSSLSTTLSTSQSLSASGMSTSLHSFDVNGGSTTWNNTTNSLSPTTAMAPNHGNSLMMQQQHQQRKCEVKLNAMPWFHGSITRDEAEHLLQPREDGLFLVRESTNFPGDYTLCVCFQGKVEHYRVKYLENKLTIDDEEYFENLGQLVAHYEADADGLCTQLIKCLPKKGKQEFCINSKDFVDKGWVIPETDLQLRESIGKGEFGDVMLGILRNEKVAVKMLKDEGAVQKFLAEASVMTTLEHENLVKFIGLVFSRKHIYLVTEYMSKGSLVDYLRSRGRQHITKKDQINFAYDTASGMEYLEAKKVVHRDLAARNVLISETCVAKVSDFGLAREECYNLEVGKLPIKWTAPEALKNGHFSNKSDIWSFGILLWEIYSFGRVPYPRIPLADVVKHVEVGYKMEAPDGCPLEIYEMMRQTWDLNPSKRPTFAELKVKLLHLKNLTS